jgi:outer membrane protein insertion porin family
VRRLLLLIFVLFFQHSLFANSSFVVDDIRLEGLERIPDGTLLNYLPLKVGDPFEISQSSYVIQTLYTTGFFKDVKLFRDGNTLVVKVFERAAISNITWSGNSDIEDEQLEEILTGIGIVKGRVFDPSALDKIEQGLKQQAYFSRGKYAVRIKTSVTELERNRVDIDIEISEGVIAKIKQVNIVGNSVFDDDVLLSELQLGVPGSLDWFSSMDEYAKPKLAADQETLKSYYQDRGYVRFSVDSTQVTITPDKKDIYISLNINEGHKYKIKGVTLAGDLKLEESELRRLILVEDGDVFSRNLMIQGKDMMQRRLGNEGYSFAKVKVRPAVNDEDKLVELNYLIEPGKKVYVRRINFSGNYKTNDEVLRREMRLMEGGELSNSKLSRSKVRLQRLAYIEQVNIKKDPVPGTDDMVDINIDVVERLSGSFNIGAGFSQSQGFVFNLGTTLDNLNGSGEKLALNLNRDAIGESYSVSFTDPYHTIDGISRTLSMSYRKRDTASQNIVNYLQNNYGVNASYGIPLSEFDRVRMGVGYEVTDIIRGTNTISQDVIDFINENNNGDIDINGDFLEASVNAFTLLASYTHDTRNRTVFATSGNSQSILLDLTTPGSDLQYYKVTYRNKFYFPVNNDVTTLIRTDLAYGVGYGKTNLYPFYERFFAGGLRTVRGYDSNTLGPKSEGLDVNGNPIASTGLPIGGDIRTVASAELIFPVPFMEKAPSSVRLSAFYDIGNVFLQSQGGFQASELRSSYGVSFIWLAPIGPLRFSYAQTVNDVPGDQTQAFQFSIGSFF